MRRLNQPIDATKYDIRGLWSGISEEHTSGDLGVVEGIPFDPPDGRPGWLLVDYDVAPGDQEPDRYWTLWIREKTKAKKAKSKAKKAVAATAPPPAAPPKPRRQRKPRPETAASAATPSTEASDPDVN